MHAGQVGPIFIGLFMALACGSTDDESKVGGTAATGNTSSGNNAGTGSINTGSGSTTGNPGGGNGSTSDPMCAAISSDGQPTQVDLYFMVDITGSMDCPVPDNGVRCERPDGPPDMGESRWTVVSAALKSFVADPMNQTLGVGMNFFPSNRNSCEASSYARPNVAIGPLSMTSQPLITAIDMQDPEGSTPTVPSLTAAIDHAKTWARANPTHRVAVVYATDGQPNGCGVSNATQAAAAVERAAAVALTGVLGTPSIPTYVLGVGPDLENLNSIAANGGTKAAFLVDTSQNAAAQLSAALASIRTTTALDCTYTIPPPPAGKQFVEGEVNIQYTNGAGTVTQIGPTATADCTTAPGWQYSADNKEINLCGQTCTDVKADKAGKIQVLFGCPTNPPEIPK